MRNEEARGKLSLQKRDGFKVDVVNGMSDTDLARKYNLSDRTATNWRVRLCGSRPKENQQ